MIQSRDNLKDAFSEGSTPSAEDFENLIDSFAHLNEDQAKLGLGIYDSERIYPEGVCVLYLGKLYISSQETTGGPWNSEHWDLVPFPQRTTRWPSSYAWDEENLGKIVGINNGLAVPYQETALGDVQSEVEIPVDTFDDLEFRPENTGSPASVTIQIKSWVASKESQLQILSYALDLNVTIIAGDQVAENVDEAEAAEDIADWINVEYASTLSAAFSGDLVEITTIGEGEIYNAGSAIFSDTDLEEPDEVAFSEGENGYAASRLYWINAFTSEVKSVVAGVDVTPGATADDTVDAIVLFINSDIDGFTAIKSDGKLKITYEDFGLALNPVTVQAMYSGQSAQFNFVGGSTEGTYSYMLPLGKLVAYGEDYVDIDDSEFVEVLTGSEIELPESLYSGLQYPLPVRVDSDGNVVPHLANSGIVFGWAFNDCDSDSLIKIRKNTSF